MPPILRIPAERVHALAGPKRDLGYRYPYGLDLVPGSKLHERIKNAIYERAQNSFDVMSVRHSTWKEIDETLTAYIRLSDKEKLIKQQDPRKPVSIVVPYSYATLETLMTYLVQAFFDSPIYRYSPVTSEDSIGTILLERIIELQSIRNKMGLNLHTQFRDGLTYGFGASIPMWDEKWGFRTLRLPDGTSQREPSMLFEGNKLCNIDPYCYLPDTTVPIHEVQKGEFVGWFEKTNYIGLLELERGNESVFNIRYLRDIEGRLSFISQSPTGRETRYGGVTGRDNSKILASSPIDVIYMYVNIIPDGDEWQIANRDLPEKWLFAVAADVVIMAQPLGLDHDMFPVTIFVPDFDGYSIAPIARLELTKGLQSVLDFLFNSHVANVRKAINDMLIVDPSIVNVNDFSNPGPGKLIRIRRDHWGRGVENAVQQLAVVDITKNHMADAAATIDIMQRTSAAVDSLMGIVKHSGERRSATESRDAKMSALSRLAKVAKIGSMMTLQDQGFMIASHTQQLLSRPTYVSITGRFQKELQEEYGIEGGMKVEPFMLNINYDVIVHDGTVEMGERADSWVQLFQVLATQPAIGAGFDIVRIFKHIARMMGAKNINDFVKTGGALKISAMQDEVVKSQASQGELEPVGGMGGQGLLEGEIVD